MPKVVKLKQLRSRLAKARALGKKIAFTNGCFDILHYGHVSYLEAAKKPNRVLVVGLNSDASVKKIKGPERPINHQEERAFVLAALACVDFVVIFEEETPYELIKAIRPDILIKGADWKGKLIVGADILKQYNGKIELIRYVPDMSTTKIIKSIQQQCRKSPV